MSTADIIFDRTLPSQYLYLGPMENATSEEPFYENGKNIEYR